jgi:hypothetical protein
MNSLRSCSGEDGQDQQSTARIMERLATAFKALRDTLSGYQRRLVSQLAVIVLKCAPLKRQNPRNAGVLATSDQLQKGCAYLKTASIAIYP